MQEGDIFPTEILITMLYAVLVECYLFRSTNCCVRISVNDVDDWLAVACVCQDRVRIEVLLLSRAWPEA